MGSLIVNSGITSWLALILKYIKSQEEKGRCEREQNAAEEINFKMLVQTKLITN